MLDAQLQLVKTDLYSRFFFLFQGFDAVDWLSQCLAGGVQRPVTVESVLMQPGRWLGSLSSKWTGLNDS